MRHDKDSSGPRDEESGPGFFERIGIAADAARSLLAIRSAIFREEISEQAGIFGRGAAAFGIAVALAGMMILLLTALIASLFTMLFGTAWAGILATFVLYLAVTAVAVMLGMKAFSKMRLDFPATKRGFSEDLASVRAALRPPPADGEDAVDVEERFRAGSE